MRTDFSALRYIDGQSILIENWLLYGLMGLLMVARKSVCGQNAAILKNE